MPREVTLTDLPAPGVPLTPEIDEVNRRLVEDDLNSRLARMQSKLSKKEEKRLKRHIARLRRRLIARRWNSLVMERDELWNEYESVKAALAWAENDDEKELIIQRGQEIAERGKGITDHIARLQPIADEYTHLCQRLEAHEQVIAWEKEDRENREAFYREAAVWEAQIKAVFKQSPRLHHIGKDGNGNEFVDIPRIEHVHVLTDRVMYKVQTSAQSVIERMISRWHSALPYGVDISSLLSEETLENLSAACNRVVTVERSKKGTNFYYVVSRVDSPDGLPERVPFARVVDWYPRDLHSKTPWFAGMSANRKVETFNFEDYPHMLIGGATKGGKSNFINQMISTLVTMNSPAELRLVLVDLKGGVEFTHWTDLKHNLIPIIKTPERVVGAMMQVRGMLDKRLELFERLKVKNLAAYNAIAAPGGKLARIIVVIDEMATLMEQDEIKVKVDKLLNVVASQGRAVGIHLVICTQRPSADVIMGWMKTNASLLISAKMPHFNASLIILGTDSAAKLPSIPGRMVFSRGRDEVICQTPYISDQEIADAVRVSQDYDDVRDDEIAAAVVPPPKKFGRDDLIQIALDQLEGKLSPTRLAEIIPESIITLHFIRQLIAGITEEGVGATVVHCGVEYRLAKLGKTFVMRAIDAPIDGTRGNRMPSEVTAITAIGSIERNKEDEYED
jgi:hypothetical protein